LEKDEKRLVTKNFPARLGFAEVLLVTGVCVTIRKVRTNRVVFYDGDGYVCEADRGVFMASTEEVKEKADAGKKRQR
jgi:hypothetical protein